MTVEDVLGHRTRKAIHQYISAYPGVAVTTIQNALGLSEGTLRYHLQYLERHNIISSRQQGNFRCCFPCQDGEPCLPRFPAVDPNTLTDIQRRLIDTVRTSPGLGITELESLTGINRRVLQYNIKVLREQMFIWKVGNGRSTQYHYATRELLQHELLKVATMKLLSGEQA